MNFSVSFNERERGRKKRESESLKDVLLKRTYLECRWNVINNCLVVRKNINCSCFMDKIYKYNIRFINIIENLVESIVWLHATAGRFGFDLASGRVPDPNVRSRSRAPRNSFEHNYLKELASTKVIKLKWVPGHIGLSTLPWGTDLRLKSKTGTQHLSKWTWERTKFKLRKLEGCGQTNHQSESLRGSLAVLKMPTDDKILG